MCGGRWRGLGDMTLPPRLVRQLRGIFLPILAIFLASRAALIVVGLMTLAYLAPEGAPAEPWTSLFCRFDCGWYMDIAAHGYSTAEDAAQPGATNFGFYPLFPLLVRIITPLFGGNALLAAITLTNMCFFVALLYVYCYVRLLRFNQQTALLTLAMLCVMPQSIVFSAAYSESPFLLLLVCAMYYLRSRQYLAAGIAAALLSATRANGIFFILFAVVWILENDGIRPFLKPWRTPEKFVPIVLAPAGFFLFAGYCLLSTGDAFAHPSTELYGWGWYFLPPWENLPRMLHSDASLATWCGIGVSLCSLPLLRKKLYAEFALCASMILLIFSGSVSGSLLRYWLVLFPIWIGVASVLTNRPVASAMTFSVLSIINGMMMAAWTLQKLIAI